MSALIMDLLVWAAVLGALVVTAGLLMAGWRWMRWLESLWQQKDAPPVETVRGDGKMRLSTTPPLEGAPPALAEQQAALDRLAALPQFGRLREGGLVHWGDGSLIEVCDCRDSRYPVPHLRLTWPGGSERQPRAVGLVGRAALHSLVRYHEALARPLVGAQPLGAETPER